MRSSIIRMLGCLLSMAVFATGCAIEAAPSPSGPLPVDLEPATLEQALESQRQLDTALQADPNDEQAWRAGEQLRVRFDELNGLVARVEVGEKHAVSFYEPSPGMILVSERLPIGGTRVVQREMTESPLELYRQLARTDVVPAALVAAYDRGFEPRPEEEEVEPTAERILPETPAASEGEVGVVRSALTEADAQFWLDSVCFKAPPYEGTDCAPGWGEGYFMPWSTKLSDFTLASLASTDLTVRLLYNGAFQFADPVRPGEWWTWHWRSARYDACSWPKSCWKYRIAWHTWDVLDAAGDRFHVSSGADWAW